MAVVVRSKIIQSANEQMFVSALDKFFKENKLTLKTAKVHYATSTSGAGMMYSALVQWHKET